MPQLKGGDKKKGYAKITDSQMLSVQFFLKRNKIPIKKIAEFSGFRESSVSTILSFKKPILEKTFIRILRASRTYCRRTDRLLLGKFDALLKKNEWENYISD